MKKWPEVSIGELTENLDSARVPLNAKQRAKRRGGIPYWGSTGVVDHIDDYLFDEPLVLVSEDGGNFDEWQEKPQAFYVNERVWINNHIHVLRAREVVRPKWLYYALLHKDLRRFLKGATRPKLNQADLNRVTVPLPPIDVQDWAVRILDAATLVPALLTRVVREKRRLKRGLLRELLTGRRRFPEFVARYPRSSGSYDGASHPWRMVALGELAEPLTRRNRVGEVRVLTCSGEHGLIDQTEYFTKSVAGESIDDYYLLEFGEFAYNRSAMNGYPFGATKRLERYERGVLSTLNICFALTSGWNGDFAAHYFESGLLNQQLRRVTRVGARAHGLLNITKADFFALKVPVPSPEEQDRIAGVLNGLDREVALLDAQRTQFELQKRALMQKLLSGKVEIHADEGVSSHA